MARKKTTRSAQVAPPVTPLKRTAIIVRDMDRSIAFYQGVLGMNIWIQGQAGAELPALYQLLGMPPCHTRWVILQSEDVAWGMVGLFELTTTRTRTSTASTAARPVSCSIRLMCARSIAAQRSWA